MTRCQILKRLQELSIVILGLLCLNSAVAFDQLSQAQSLIYDTGHLANTHKGQQIIYRYEASDDGSEPLLDQASLTIRSASQDGRRDVDLSFLSENRQLPLPPFNGYRGNPAIIAMLEHIAQSLGAQTGGGALYFRNRIRDALAAEDLTIKDDTSSYQNKIINTQSLAFSPFLDDTLLENSSVYRNTKFSIQFSDQVPAGVLDITVHAASDNHEFFRRLHLE